MTAASTWRLSLLAGGIALLLGACGSSAPRRSPAKASGGAPPAVAARRTVAGLTPSPPQQPSDPPVVVAMEPDLPPLAGPLVSTPVRVSPALGDRVAGRALNLPAGFQASVYALPGGGPRFMALSPDGHLFVTLIGRGQVVELLDDGSGVAATTQTVLSGLNQPHGIAFDDGYLYVGETNQIVRVPYTDGVVQKDAKEVVIANLPTGGHATRTVNFGPEGVMYVAVGSSCNVCLETNPLRAAITAFAPDGSGRQPFATGLRNAVGFVFQPGTGDMWATVNGRDNIGDDMGLSGADATRATDNLPPDYVTRVSAGGDYGWPRCYGDHQLDPKFGDAAFCATTLAPSVELQAHSAPLGLGFYTGSSFPAEFQGDLFVALHGSWNRSTKTGYKVVRVKFENGQPARVEDFATGWLEGAGAWGRPVDAITGPDGALYISDDSGGAIYRISYGGN